MSFLQDLANGRNTAVVCTVIGVGIICRYKLIMLHYAGNTKMMGYSLLSCLPPPVLYLFPSSIDLLIGSLSLSISVVGFVSNRYSTVHNLPPSPVQEAEDKLSICSDAIGHQIPILSFFHALPRHAPPR